MKTLVAIFLFAAVAFQVESHRSPYGSYVGSSYGNGYHNYRPSGHGSHHRHPYSTTQSSSNVTGMPISTASPLPAIESKSLDQLHKEALAEGGRVIVYAGGDVPGQQDDTKTQFEKRFPGMTLDIIVDYSKFHNGRIDNQLATSTLIPDVVQLQTLQDFPIWKQRGVLLQYRPKRWDQIYEQFKDSDGFFTGIFVDSFNFAVSTTVMPDNTTWPKEGIDLLRPEFKGKKIILAYPNDDDAVLFWFKLMVDKYGWNFVDQFVKQEPVYVRGTEQPGVDLIDGKYSVAVGIDGLLKSMDNPKTQYIVSEKDPFVTWPQTAAIFKDAKHPAAAKLYLNWVLSPEFQRDYWYQWSVCKDIPAPAGYKNIFNYSNSDPTAFGKWMSDRQAVESFKTQITLYIGDVVGSPSPGSLGLHPDKALPH